MTEAPNLSRMIRDVLNQCLADGMKAPLILCAMSPNGSVLVMRFLGQGGPDKLAQNFEAGGFRLPMSIVVLEAFDCR
jgi:hypothetical protein